VTLVKVSVVDADLGLVRCTKQFVPTVERNVKFRSSPHRTDPFTARIAS
jgi:hypothetical protein